MSTGNTYDVVVVGGGLIGLSTARALRASYPGLRVLVLEKEEQLAQHQSGRNSGVLHSGLYYPQESEKARLTAAGRQAMLAFCDEHALAYDLCGKVVVATREEELPRLQALYQRGLENGLDISLLDESGLREIEPHARALRALWVPAAGIVDFPAVNHKLAELLAAEGVEVRRGSRVTAIRESADGLQLKTNRGVLRAGFLVNCAGLFSDRLARMSGLDPGVRIVPFRGEYYGLRKDARDRVRGLIYPLPAPDFPFLGVHLTRMIDGQVLAGPNAVLAYAREGYKATDINLRDLGEALAYPGFLRLALGNLGRGLGEMLRAWSPRAFVRDLQRMLPGIEAKDLHPARAGIRAQALGRDGKLVNDFLFARGERSLHVVNAPSPGATASLAIGRHVASQLEF